MNDRIMDIFHQIEKEKKPLQLLNVYKGVPISYEADLVATGPEAIRVKTEKHQVVCLYSEKETYIQSDMFPDLIKARVSKMYLSRLESDLAEFEYVTSGIGDRMQIRVQPKDAIEGGIRTGDMAEADQGELADVSRAGLAIYIGWKEYVPGIYSKGTPVTLTLRFPGEYQIRSENEAGSSPEDNPLYRFSRSGLRFFHLPEVAKTAAGKTERDLSTRQVRFPEMVIQGTIVNITEQRVHFRYRIGIRISPIDPSRAMISQFIAQRQSEIIREINTVFKLLAQMQGM